MLKTAVQQDRSERRGKAYASVRGASERRENAAGRLFQHPASDLARGCSGQQYMPGVRGSQVARLSGSLRRWQRLGKSGSEQSGRCVRRNVGNRRCPAGRFLRVPLKGLVP